MSRDPSASPIRRQKGGRRAAPPESPAVDAAEVPRAIASPTVTPAAPVAAPRELTDFEGLRAIGEMDPAEVRAMMDAFTRSPARGDLRAGQRVRARVSNVGSMVIFCDVGGKADATLDRIEVTASITAGDTIDAFVLSTDGGELRLTLKPSGSAVREMLEEAMNAKIAVDGKVAAAGEAGWDVTLADGVRAFCPGSHCGVPDVADGAHLGRVLAFHVYDLRGRDVVVSRKQIVEAESRAADSARLGELREGSVHDATVVSLREFGAFVKLANGAEGLVHLSNLADRRVKHPSEVVKEGDAVRVRVLAIDTARRRLDLGIKQAVEISAGRNDSAGFNQFAALLKDVRVRR
ncbi:MAG: S1 RNA-binding domain-containing protein [Deltaproteobacteria bacterium]|nr:S1 RNA-binding domain-containing protein [Deltaproteobacteria bacterium]